MFLQAGVFDPHNETLAIELNFLPLWLAKISITPKMQEEQPELSDRLLEYQLKAKDALAKEFLPKAKTYSSTSEMERLKIQVQGDRAQAMLINAKCKLYKELSKSIENKNLSPVAVELFGIIALEEVTGKKIDYRPPCDKTYSATEMGEIVGASSAKIGRLANTHSLKTPEYGIEVLDKSRYSSKEVPNFRYYESAIPKFRELLGG